MGLELAVQNDQRLIMLGQTRMGKTHLTGKLVEDQPRVIVIDSKGRVKWRGFHLTDNPMAALLQDRVIYRPRGGRPPDAWFPYAMQTLHERGGGIIYVDELPVVCTADKIGDGLAETFRLGGELGVGVWGSAQESTTVHNTVLRQSEEIVMFYNQGASDRDKMMRIVGDMAAVTEYLKPYQFIVFERGETYGEAGVPIYQADK